MTAYHPECDGMVERFNHTLKSMLCKRVAQFGAQWDKNLSGVLWAYRNTPHETTGEKPLFLPLGWDCRSPTEAAFLPTEDVTPTSVSDYREELMLNLYLARKSVLESSQGRYKKQYDRKTDEYQYRTGDWVLIRFPSDETGKPRKLSRPWHGPYRIISCNDTNITAVKVYFPHEDAIKVHQTRVKPCPKDSWLATSGTETREKGRVDHLSGWRTSSQDSAEESVGQSLAETEPENESSGDPHTTAENDSEDLKSGAQEQETTGSRKRSGRYSLRGRVHPPDQLLGSAAWVELL